MEEHKALLNKGHSDYENPDGESEPRLVIELSRRDSLLIADSLLNARPLTSEMLETIHDHSARVKQQP